MLPKPFIRKASLSARAASLEKRLRQTVVRYALAPTCVVVAALVYLSPVGPILSLAGLFVFAVLATGWFGGAGPGFLAAVLATFALPQLIAVPYPLLGGFLDLPRFITFSVIGLVVGWGSSRMAGVLRDQDRYARAMEASDDGFWDWVVADDTLYVSPRFLEIYGFEPGTRFSGRDDLIARIPFYAEDRPILKRAFAEHLDGKAPRYGFEARFIRDGETRWVQLAGKAAHDRSGVAVRLTGTVRDITERKHAEEALRESEERFALALSGSYDGIWVVDFVARTVFFSARTRELCGLPAGPEVVPLDGWFEALPLHPDDRPRRAAAVEAHLSGTAPAYEGDFRLLQPDGVYRWRRLHGLCARDDTGNPLRMAGSISDVDARRRAEDALRESEERYELAMAASESGYWDWDVSANKYVVSPRAYELAGYPSGTTWADRDDYRARINMHPDDSARWEAARDALFAGTGERLSMEARYIVNGATRWHSLQGLCRRDDAGKVLRWTGSTTDITARKQAEDELKTMERKLRQAQRLESMGTLAGGIAHDFNNILGAILGYGEMALRDAPEGSRLARDVDSIMVAGERGRALVERLLAFSRSAAGERVPVHVEAVVREVLGLVSAKLQPNVAVRAELRAGPAAVLGDATQVHQVVANLVTNAIQAMPGGGTLRVELAIERVEAPRVGTIGAREVGDYVVLTVADTGAGIAPEIIDRIFDPFFTTKEVGTGTGLGLSLVHGIVTQLGGAIDVASITGNGSMFIVYLPRSGDAAEPPAEEESAPPRGAGQRVMVVDDEEPLVQLATRTLAHLGYVPIGFTSSAAALEAFRAAPELFDVLITDEHMAEMSGSALIREVRRMRGGMPVVLMSGYLGAAAGHALEHGRSHTLSGGPDGALAIEADEVLQKPISARDLAAGLARALRL